MPSMYAFTTLEGQISGLLVFARPLQYSLRPESDVTQFDAELFTVITLSVTRLP